MVKHLQVFVIVLGWSFLFLSFPVDSYVPVTVTGYIQKDTAHLDVPDVFDAKTERQWYSIGKYIVNTNYKVYVLNWRGYGGLLTTGKEFISRLEQAKRQGKTIILNLVGPSYSMHALVVCYVKDVINKKDNYLMFHADGFTRQGVEVRTTRGVSRINQELDVCMRHGVITSGDITALWNGYEIYRTNTKTWYNVDPRPLAF